MVKLYKGNGNKISWATFEELLGDVIAELEHNPAGDMAGDMAASSAAAATGNTAGVVLPPYTGEFECMG